MEDTIRCPMCSRLNPADRDTCQYCQARLKPLVAGSAGATPSQPETPGEGLPDWLDSFRGEDQSAAEAEPTSPDEDVPDWLARIRERNHAENGSAASPDQNGMDDLPDWLRDETEPAAESPQAGEESQAEGRLDWLDDIREESGESPAEGQGDQSVDDWLETLRDEPAEAESQPEAGESAPAGEDQPAGENLEWWSALAGNDQSPTSETQDEILLDRVESFSAGEDEPSSGAGAVGGEQEPPAEPATQFPEWLSEIPKPEIPADEEEIPAEPATQFPEWLSEIPKPETPPEEEPPVTYNWPAFGAAAPAPSPEPFSFEDKGAGPDAAAPQEAEEDGAPSWLSNLDRAREAPPPISDIPTQRIRPVKPASMPEPDETPPDWLSALGSGGGEVQPPSSAPFMEDAPEVPVNNLSADPFVMSELPDWLSSLGSARDEGEDLSGRSGPLEFGGDELAPAELPSWVKAMRPIESIASDTGVPQENDQRVERSGPLAGLRGVLPMEPSISEYRKPPLYSAKLRASDSQTRYAEILEELLSNETAPLPARPERLISSQRILRLVIGLLLVAAVVAGVLYPLIPAPATPPAETAAFKAALDGLAADRPVLVIVDYEPALAGEMEAAAAGPLSQLMAQGVPLALVSTSPTGPALASHLLDSVAAAAPASTNTAVYLDGEKAAQLGYLAGGPAGMYNFLVYPATTAPGWSQAQPLFQGASLGQGVQRALLLTDSSDVGQDWVEQWTAARLASPDLGQVPLLLVSSAQAAPLLRPYLDAQQFAGMISGVEGGAVYEQTLGQVSLANRQWNGYIGGLAAAVLLILVGGVINSLIHQLRHRKSKDEG